MKNPDALSARPRSGRRRAGAETRQRIFESAIELFAERGPAAVTVVEIARRAEVAKGTFFYHFESKDAVLASFALRQVERMERELRDAPPRGLAREILHRALTLLGDSPEITRALAGALFLHSMAASAMSGSGAGLWRARPFLADVIRAGQESGEIRQDQDADALGLFLLGQFILSLLTWATSGSRRSLGETVDGYIRLALDGLASGES